MLEDDEEKEISVRKKIDTQLLRKCIKTQMWIVLYDEPSVMWAHAYVALSTRINTFFVIKKYHQTLILGLFIWK